ncbi:MAG TPA: uracil-DNA glycosylase [Methylophilaceae bacterium]|nr:uracil-DNA glycosylase [Methylophilaceae bacterium]
MIKEAVPPDWLQVLPELQSIADQINAKLSNETDIRPVPGLWFEALRCVSPQQVAVVILGQDPYHGEDKGIKQAHGLAFSVPDGVRPPPSLKNILAELQADTGNKSAVTGNLSSWCQQGVLLLNASLTTRGGIAGAHRKLWTPFTSALMEYLGSQPRPVVFILWGADAQKYKAVIGPQHVVIESVHPSPLSSYRGFFGSKPFSKCNAALAKNGRDIIKW